MYLGFIAFRLKTQRNIAEAFADLYFVANLRAPGKLQGINMLHQLLSGFRFLIGHAQLPEGVANPIDSLPVTIGVSLKVRHRSNISFTPYTTVSYTSFHYYSYNNFLSL